MSRAHSLIPACLGGLLSMAAFYLHSNQLPKLLLLGLLGGLAGGWFTYLLGNSSLGPPENLQEAIRSGALQGGLAGLWGGLAGWILLCLWNGPGHWLGLTPLP